MSAVLEKPVEPPGPLREFWQGFAANRGAFFALVVFALIALASLFAPLIAPHDPIEQYRDFMLTPPVWVEGGSTRFLLGTDELGRDMLSRLLHGGRVSLGIGLAAVAMSLLPGVLFAASEAGLQVPRDLSVIAGADSDLARLSHPGVTAVYWPHDVLGRAAGRFLVRRLADPATARQTLTVRAQLLVRGSCAPPASASEPGKSRSRRASRD